jgi:hypothetical protein
LSQRWLRLSLRRGCPYVQSPPVHPSLSIGTLLQAEQPALARNKNARVKPGRVSGKPNSHQPIPPPAFGWMVARSRNPTRRSEPEPDRWLCQSRGARPISLLGLSVVGSPQRLLGEQDWIDQAPHVWRDRTLDVADFAGARCFMYLGLAGQFDRESTTPLENHLGGFLGVDRLVIVENQHFPGDSLVRSRRLELPRVAPQRPQRCASTNSATTARGRGAGPCRPAACSKSFPAKQGRQPHIRTQPTRPWWIPGTCAAR